MKMTELIEKEKTVRAYGISGTNAIIRHDDDLLLICDGFRGIDSLSGAVVRWEYGSVYRLLPGDTLSSLQRDGWNKTTTHWQAIIQGCDSKRPVLCWSGYVIAAIAERVGL